MYTGPVLTSLWDFHLTKHISSNVEGVQQEINFIGHVTTHAAKKNLYSNLSTWTWRLTLLEDSFTKLLAFKRENRSGVTSLWNLPTVERYFPRIFQEVVFGALRFISPKKRQAIESTLAQCSLKCQQLHNLLWVEAQREWSDKTIHVWFQFYVKKTCLVKQKWVVVQIEGKWYEMR